MFTTAPSRHPNLNIHSHLIQLTSSLHLDPELSAGEGVLIERFGDDLLGRLAGAVTRRELDSKEDWVGVGGKLVLEDGGELEAMRRGDAVVV